MGRRKGRRRPTRREKMTACKKAGIIVVAVGKKKPGRAEVIRPDFRKISPAGRKIVADIARRMNQDPEVLYNKVSQ